MPRPAFRVDYAFHEVPRMVGFSEKRMTDDSSDLPSIQKLPFIIGYVLMWGLAIAIAVTQGSDDDLGTGAMIAIVLTSLLGLVFLVAPFFYEYSTHLEFAKAELEATLESERKISKDLRSELEAAQTNLAKLSENAAAHTAALEKLSQDSRFDLTELEKQLAELIDAIKPLAEAKAPGQAPDIKADLNALKAAVAMVANDMKALPKSLESSASKLAPAAPMPTPADSEDTKQLLEAYGAVSGKLDDLAVKVAALTQLVEANQAQAPAAAKDPIVEEHAAETPGSEPDPIADDAESEPDSTEEPQPAEGEPTEAIDEAGDALSLEPEEPELKADCEEDAGAEDASTEAIDDNKEAAAQATPYSSTQQDLFDEGDDEDDLLDESELVLGDDALTEDEADDDEEGDYDETLDFDEDEAESIGPEEASEPPADIIDKQETPAGAEPPAPEVQKDTTPEHPAESPINDLAEDSLDDGDDDFPIEQLAETESLDDDRPPEAPDISFDPEEPILPDDGFLDIEEPEEADETAEPTPYVSADLEITDAEEGDDVILVARMHIGIGNTPFVRGEGGPLSQDKGVPMRFVEIGKWEWRTKADSPVLVQIYKNDEDPAREAEFAILPGQAVTVRPTFN